MLILQITDVPKWTDIVQAIGVFLGVPTVVWGIFKLFRKNKNLEKQITALSGIAESQNQLVIKMSEEISELKNQTEQFRVQSVLMKDGNDLTRELLEIQSNAIASEHSLYITQLFPLYFSPCEKYIWALSEELYFFAAPTFVPGPPP